MALTISQSIDVNVLCSFILGPLDSHEGGVAENEAMEALAKLAAHANKAMMAGWDDSRVRSRWPNRPQKTRRKGGK
jgi:hypothetical protein